MLVTVWLLLGYTGVMAQSQETLPSNVNITTGNPNLSIITTAITSTTNCSTQTGYGSTGSLAFGNLAQFSSVTINICVQDTGSPITLTFTPDPTAPLPSTLTLTWPPTTIAHNGFVNLALTLTDNGTPVGTVSFNEILT